MILVFIYFALDSSGHQVIINMVLCWMQYSKGPAFASLFPRTIGSRNSYSSSGWILDGIPYGFTACPPSSICRNRARSHSPVPSSDFGQRAAIVQTVFPQRSVLSNLLRSLSLPVRSSPQTHTCPFRPLHWMESVIIIESLRSRINFKSVIINSDKILPNTAQ